MIGLKYLDYLSNVDEESLLLGEADSWDLVLLLNVCELPPAHHLQGLDVTEILVECEVSVNLELNGLIPVGDQSLVIVSVGSLDTLRLLVVPAEQEVRQYLELTEVKEVTWWWRTGPTLQTVCPAGQSPDPPCRDCGESRGR